MIALLLFLPACGSTRGEPIRLDLPEQDGSAVTGTVTLTPVSEERTEVRVEVDDAGHANMPAHIHSGTCDEMVPQPKFPLQNALDGVSITEVPASLDQLRDGSLVLNLHQSNAEMGISVACIELG